MNKIKWIIFAFVVVAIFGAIIFFSRSNSSNYEGDVNKIIPATDQALGDHAIGSQEQKVVLIEYGDFQCPGCRGVDAPVKAIAEEYKDRLTFIFRHMPLTNIHPNALAAATAAEAAGLQGKYWEMHAMLFETQDAWGSAPIDQRAAIFEGYASNLSLNVDQFNQDLRDPRITDKINRDRGIGRQIGVNQTPWFVLNGTQIDAQTSTDPEALRQKVGEALRQAYPEMEEGRP